MRHWQLFLLLAGLPMLVPIAMVGSVMASIISDSVNPDLVFDLMGYVPLVMVMPTIFTLVWLWSIVAGLRPLLPPEYNLRMFLFSFLLIFPLITNTGFAVLIMASFQDLEFESSLFFVIAPLQLIGVFCLFRSYYVAAKVVKSVERQRPVTFGECSGEFLMLLFFPVGVWFLQPKLNKLVREMVTNK